MMLMNIFIKPIVIFIFLTLFSSFSVAVDIPPGQAIAPPPGKSSIRFELNSVKLGEGFKSGKSLNLGSELNVNTLGVQYSRSFMIRDRLAGFYINGAVGKALPGGSISSQENISGITDSAAALVTWLHADKEKGRYVVLGGFVIFPTGDYDSDRAINFSQNRFSGGFQFGYHTRLAPKWDLMVTTDVMFSEKNEDYRLTHQVFEQDPLYSAQFTLMHNFDPSITVSGTYYRYLGGEGRLDGEWLANKITRNRYEFVFAKRIQSGKYFVYLGKDADTNNGVIEDRRLSLRYQHYF